jgi:hypothetical protein
LAKPQASLTLTIKTQAKRPRSAESLPDIFTRLEARGVNYAKVKAIVQFALPQALLHFSRSFPGLTIDFVFRRLGRMEALLKTAFVVSYFSDVNSQFEQRLKGLSRIAIQALIEANGTIGGAWSLCVELQPTGQDEKGRAMYIRPPFRILATHRKRKQSLAVQLQEGESVTAVKQAFEGNGIWKELWKADPGRLLVSRRAEQGWPVYTSFVLPPLYEFLVPYYPSAGHHWAKHGVRTDRLARLPQELLKDMLEILRMEHYHVFQHATLPQLKALVQGHLARNSAKEVSRRKI